MRRNVSRVGWVVVLLMLAAASFGAEGKLTRVEVNGVELHFVEEGAGEPLILLHGGQGDYRSWKEQVPEFARKYRVISYSRRFHYPNNNRIEGTNHSAWVEA